MKTRQAVGLLFFVIAVLLGIDISAYGQSGVFDQCGIIPRHGTYSSLPEESVDLFTGNLTLRYRDIFLPGPNGLNIEVWRVYNSKILNDKPSTQQNPTIQAYPKSMIGIGWSMHMGMVYNYDTNTPIIEFPDGRRETAYTPKAEYGYPSNILMTRDFLKYHKGNFPTDYPRLYFKDGIVWTFGHIANLPLAGGGSRSVLMVTRIEDQKGNYIEIEYDITDLWRSIKKISDSMGREVRFAKIYQGSEPAKLAEIWVRNYDDSHDVIYSYSVGSFDNGFYKLVSFTPPLLPPTTFDYNDGMTFNYELARLTTSYGGVLEFSYVTQQFYFKTTALDSRVVSQKRITFDPGEQAIWNFAYPTYQGVTSATTSVQGPLYSTQSTHYAYDSSNPWRIGLNSSGTVSDGSSSSSFAWTYYEFSNVTWSVLGTSMGKAKAPILLSCTSNSVGDATLKQQYYYDSGRPNVRRYGLPTKIEFLVNGSTTKSYKELSYFYETHQNYFDKYMLGFIASETDKSATNTIIRKSISTYYEEDGKWGALKKAEKLKSGTTYLTWDYGYNALNPHDIEVTADGPGSSGNDKITYSYGLKRESSTPSYVDYTSFISKYSYVRYERNQHGGSKTNSYDDLGRIVSVDYCNEWDWNCDPPEDPPPPFMTIEYNWRPGGENTVEITQGENLVTKYWDGMGRDLGYTETGDDITLYHRKKLDAEGRVIEANSGSLNQSHKYYYTYDNSNRVTGITDPVGEITNIEYEANTKVITDPEDHTTSFLYGDLPGQPTKLTDAQGHIADYTYDSVGRLTKIEYNNKARTQTYSYDGLGNITSEEHPETGKIDYIYNAEGKVGEKRWGTISSFFNYNDSGQVVAFSGAEVVTYGHDEKGRINSVVGSLGWSRSGITYNSFGAVTHEEITYPGMSTKSVSYDYDNYGNLTKTKYPDETFATQSYNALLRPETLSFNKTLNDTYGLVTGASYGPNKTLAGLSFVAIDTTLTLSSTFYNNGAPNNVSLVRGSTPLYDATYQYDGAGNITGISSAAPTNPTLNSTFGYDSLNRLISATYSPDAVGSYSYEYDAYGNMVTARHGANVENMSYNGKNQNQDTGYNYDLRGNLLSKPNGVNYRWDAQNRLTSVTDISGQYLADYRYDDRGLRIASFPPVPDINVVSYPSDSSADMSSSLNSPSYKTFTVNNLGLANLSLNMPPPEGQDGGLFTVYQQPASPIPPGQSSNFIIQFLPTSTGDKNATLSIQSNDPDESQYVINLKGYCEPDIEIGGVPNGGTYDFGSVGVGESSREIFELLNMGTATLLINGMPILQEPGGESNFYYEQEDKPIPSDLPAQGHALFAIRFVPMGEGLKTATLTFHSNDVDEEPYAITLMGTGLNITRKISDKSAIAIVFPNGGEKLEAGSLRDITWEGGDGVKYVRIEYSEDNGSTYQTIVEKAVNIGTYPWDVPANISDSCLIRISDAEGAPLMPVQFSYEFKFKVSAPNGQPSEGSHFVFRGGVPDLASQTYRVAEVSFTPDKLRGSENLLLNNALAEVQDIEKFLDAWHQARITYDMTNYTGSVWIDDQPVLANVPLNIDLNIQKSPEISFCSNSDVPLKVWIDDMDVKYVDRSWLGDSSGEVVYKPLFRDKFNKYQRALFPKRGGWITAKELVFGGDNIIGKSAESGGDTTVETQTDESALSTVIDDEEYSSSYGSFRLENTDAEKGVAGKRISLPLRTPFSVSAENFTISVSGQGLYNDEINLRLSGRDRADERMNRREKRQRGNMADSRKLSPARSRRMDMDVEKAGQSKRRSVSITNKNGQIQTLSGIAVTGAYYFYSFDGRLLAEYNYAGLCVRDYIYFGGRMVAEYDVSTSAFYYYASDQINSTRIVTDRSGEVVYSVAYNPFGEIQETWDTTNPHNPSLKFSGKPRDAESELDYFGARYYDRSLYRFLSVDPVIPAGKAVANPQRWNLYAYCLDNPVSYIDPNGAEAIKITIVRQVIENNVCIGEIWVNGIKYGNTAENPDTMLKEGTYKGGLVYRWRDIKPIIVLQSAVKQDNGDYRIASIIPGEAANSSILHECIFVTSQEEYYKIVDAINEYSKNEAWFTAAVNGAIWDGSYGSQVDMVFAGWDALEALGWIVSSYDAFCAEVEVTIQGAPIRQ